MIIKFLTCAAIALAANTGGFTCVLPDPEDFNKDGKATEIPWLKSEDGTASLSIVKDGIKVQSGTNVYVISPDDMQAAYILSGTLQDE